MKDLLRLIATATFLLVSLAILGLNDFNVGTDAGIHYEFSEDLARHRKWPLPAEADSPVMSHYPPAAHILGLLLGRVAGATLYGMFLVTAISFVTIYLVLAELMRRASLAETFLAYFLFVLSALLFRAGRFLEGNEIVANFFFAQFAGTAAFLASFLLLYRLKLKQPFMVWLAIAASATHLVAWIYTINAIELALSCVMVLFLDLLNERSRQSAVKLFVAATVLGLVSIVHPTMIGSIGIAGNDGGISIKIYTLIIGFLGLLIGSIVLSISCDRAKLINCDGLLALCFGVLIACTLQSVALIGFNIGSAYAVKKYGFLIGTLCVVVFVLLAVEHARIPWAQFVRRLPTVVCVVMVPLFGIVSLLTITAFRPRTAVDQLVDKDREVRLFWMRNTRVDLEGNTILSSSNLSPHVNYTIGLGVLSPKNAMDDQHAVLLPNPRHSGAGFILTDAEHARSLDRSCILVPGEQLVVVRGACAASKIRNE